MPRAAGRKTLKQEALQGDLEIQPGQCIAKVISLRGSNIIEVEDDKPNRSLCLLPAKFNKMLWIKKGSFVVVQEGERDKAIESGSKVTGIISQVLFEEQIRSLKRRSLWPHTFKEATVHTPSSKKHFIDQIEDEHELSQDSCTDDEGLPPPLEANQNRRGMSYNLEESSSEEE